MITRITDLKKSKAHTLTIEYIDAKSGEYYKKLGFDPRILEQAAKNHALKKDAEKTMTFYGDFF